MRPGRPPRLRHVVHATGIRPPGLRQRGEGDHDEGASYVLPVMPWTAGTESTADTDDLQIPDVQLLLLALEPLAQQVDRGGREDGAEDPPQQRPLLQVPGYRERTHDEDEDDEVVLVRRLLDEVPGVGL